MKIRLYGTGTIAGSDESPGGGIHTAQHEILHITGGKVRFRWTGNVCDAEAPAVFLISPAVPHELESLVPESKYRYFSLADISQPSLTESQVDDWNFMQTRRDTYSKTVLAAAILQSLEFAHHLYATGEATRHHGIEQICELEIRKIYLLIAHALNASSARHKDIGHTRKRDAKEAVNVLADYMDWRYKENITLEAMADLVRLNPSYLVRAFKKYKQVTPFEYLRDLRLKAAASYLSGSDMPISAIVEKSGFNSVHYFGRLFKQVYGQSPAEWRKQLKRKV